jgi:hypothetical protein
MLLEIQKKITYGLCKRLSVILYYFWEEKDHCRIETTSKINLMDIAQGFYTGA